MSAHYHVFLSHSHGDSEFVEALARRMEDEAHLRVWLDKWVLVPGEEWQHDMARGISEALSCAVFIGSSTPQGWFDQEIQRALNRQSREKSFRVIPVLLPGSNPKEIDSFLELRTWVDFRRGLGDHDAFRRLIAGIRGDAPGRGQESEVHAVDDFTIYVADPNRSIPFQVPPLPAYFVPRPEISNPIKQNLLESNSSTKGVTVISAIHGLGGIGKSVLAAALAFDNDLKEKYRDGVLWVTLGQKPDLLAFLWAWIQALGDYDFTPRTISTATAHLRSLLYQRACLLVVDDAWEADDVRPFLVSAPRCRILVTTRRADVASEINSSLHQVDVMTPEQSISLLTSRLNRPIYAEELRDAQQVAKLVGHLPLALELVAARIAKGIAWTQLQEAFSSEIVRLEELEDRRRVRKGNLRLEACFNLTLDALRANDEEAWKSFIWLAILPEDISLAAPLATTLWNVAESEAEDLLEALWNDALLAKGLPVTAKSKTWNGYRIHDLVRDIARRLLVKEEPDGLGLTLFQANLVFLNRYKKQIKNDLWHTIPDDGYIHQHLIWHLEKLDQINEIHALLREETENSKNGWYEVCDELGAIASYITDISRAWEFTKPQINNEGNYGLMCRYALMISALNSLAKSIPPRLLAALVRQNHWTFDQGLTYARQSPDPQHRDYAMAELISCLLESNHVKEVISVIHEIHNRKLRIEKLVELSPYLSDEKRDDILLEALDLISEIDDSDIRWWSLAGLVAYLPSHLLARAFTAISGREILPAESTTISDVALRLRSNSQQIEIISSWPKLFSGHSQTSTQSKNYDVEQALREALQLQNAFLRASTLVKIIPDLNKQKQELALNETINAVENIDNVLERSQILDSMAPLLSGTLLKRALLIAKNIHDEIDLVLAKFQTVSYLSEQFIDDLVEVAKNIQQLSTRARALNFLFPHVKKTTKDEIAVEIINLIRQIENPNDRSNLLIDYSRQVDDAPSSMVRSVCMEFKDEQVRLSTLISLAPHVSEDARTVFLDDCLSGIQEIADWGVKSDLLLRFAELGFSEQALKIALSIPNRKNQVEIMLVIVRYLPAKRLTDVLNFARTIPNENQRASLLVELASSIEKPLQKAVVSEALDAIQLINEESEKSRFYAALIPYARKSIMDNILKVSRGFLRPKNRAQILIGSISRTKKAKSNDVIAKTLIEISKINDDIDKANLLSRLAPFLSVNFVNDALKTARAIGNLVYKTNTLINLAPIMPIEQKKLVLQEAMQTAQELTVPQEYSHALTELARGFAQAEYVPEAQTIAEKLSQGEERDNAYQLIASQLAKQNRFSDALLVVQKMQSKERRSQVLANIVPSGLNLPESSLSQSFEEFLRTSSTRTREEMLSDLQSLFPIIHALGGNDAMVEVFHAIQDVGSWWA